MGKMIKFDHVNAHGSFEAVLNHYNLEYTRKGTQLRLLCPLHEDTNPSLSVTLEADSETKANTWHCFGCQNSGSLIDFVAHLDGCDLRAAAELVAELSGCGLAPCRGGKAKTAKRGAQSHSKARIGPKQQKGRPTTAKRSEAGSGGSQDTSDAAPPQSAVAFLANRRPAAPVRVGSAGGRPRHQLWCWGL